MKWGENLRYAKIAVLVSGGGTNLQALIDAEKNGILQNGKIIHVISSKSGAYALERAKKANIRADVVEFKNNSGFENAILSLLDETKPDVIVLAGFMHILSADFVNKYKGRMVNIHPSLIPAFCGKGFYGLKVHEAVLNAGVKITGATVHIVNEIPDGGEILKQKAVKVFLNDTPEILQKRVMEQAEWQILPCAVEELCMRINMFGFENNSYPGRGVMIGCDNSGRMMFAYFIMGRSASSRARVFERDPDNKDDLLIKLIDTSSTSRSTASKDGLDDKKVNDTSLILYKPVRKFDNYLIVTNGDQTDTAYDFLNHGGTFEDALRTREFEPDPPHFTPRISGILDLKTRKYKLSILKAQEPVNHEKDAVNVCCREFFEYHAIPGTAHLIHTYNGNGDILPSFTGEPKLIKNISADIDEFTENLWNALDNDNKVSLYVRYINDKARPASRTINDFEDRIFNKYKI